jgi:hypothetical protein
MEALRVGFRGVVAALCVALGCVPGGAGETSGMGESSSTSGETGSSFATEAGGSSTASEETGGPGALPLGDAPADETTVDGTTVDATTADETTAGETTWMSSSGDESTTEVGPCVNDPAQGLCTAACDYWTDCCKCDGQVLTAPVDPSVCAFKAGIVVDACWWGIRGLEMDGAELEETFGCGPGAGWSQFQLEGDIEIQLCGDACEKYKAGEFRELEVLMDCEVA